MFVGADLIRIVRSSIRSKLLLGMLIVAVIPLLVLGAAVYINAEQAVMAKAVDQLEAVRTIKANQLQQHFMFLESQVSTFAENPMVIDAMQDFRKSFRSVVEENEVSPDELANMRKQLRSYYAVDYSDEYRKRNPNKSPNVSGLFDGLDDESVYLQYEYIRSNPNPLGDKEKLDRAGDRSTYSEHHAKFHPVIRSYLQTFGLYDVFLADLETGDVVY